MRKGQYLKVTIAIILYLSIFPSLVFSCNCYRTKLGFPYMHVNMELPPSGGECKSLNNHLIGNSQTCSEDK
jgi:hypothetical protein